MVFPVLFILSISKKTIQKEVFILQNPKTEETITRVNGAALLQL